MSDEARDNEPRSADEWYSAMGAWTEDRNALIARAEQAESQNQALQEAARNAHGILQTNLGDVDPHVRAACDLLWNALSPTQETD